MDTENDFIKKLDFKLRINCVRYNQNDVIPFFNKGHIQ